MHKPSLRVILAVMTTTSDTGRPAEGSALTEVTLRGRLIPGMRGGEVLLDTEERQLDLLAVFGTEFIRSDHVEVVGVPAPRAAEKENAALLVRHIRSL